MFKPLEILEQQKQTVWPMISCAVSLLCYESNFTENESIFVPVWSLGKNGPGSPGSRLPVPQGT